MVSSNATYLPNFENARSLDITPDGRFVVYVSTQATNVYRWDGQNNTTTLVSANQSGAAPVGAVCEWPVVDATGRYVAFFCTSNLSFNTVSGDYNLFVRDMERVPMIGRTNQHNIQIFLLQHQAIIGVSARLLLRFLALTCNLYRAREHVFWSASVQSHFGPARRSQCMTAKC